MKNLIHIIAIVLFFSIAANAQNDKQEPPQKEKEKIEFASLNAFVNYLEAVKKGEAAPIDQVVLEKEYARLVREMDREFHNSKSVERPSENRPVTTSNDYEENLGDTE